MGWEDFKECLIPAPLPWAERPSIRPHERQNSEVREYFCWLRVTRHLAIAGMGFGRMEVDKHCSRNFSWGLNRTSGCVRLGERAGDNLVSLSTDEAIKRIVALLRSAGDELDRQVRELGTAGWGWGICSAVK